MSLSDLIAKIAALPENRLAEIERYVDTIAQTEKPAQGRGLPEIVAPTDGDFDEPPDEHEGEAAYVRADLPSGFGCLKGRIVMRADFDAPLEEFEEYM